MASGLMASANAGTDGLCDETSQMNGLVAETELNKWPPHDLVHSGMASPNYERFMWLPFGNWGCPFSHPIPRN